MLADLGAAGGEVPNHLLADALDLGHAVLHGMPFDADAFDELAAEGHLVEEPGSAGVRVERLAVEGSGPAFGLGRVGHDGVGV